ncbi:MAG TPA: ribonuclease PH [Candidatus Omnitrophota bacterium]|nr:ribonuclease PH [Candidatus Omnitrophota bacterium]
MKRTDGRLPGELRKIRITKDYVKHAEGSCLIEFGETRVICTATVEENVPLFLRNKGKGWVTAEYGMLPRSCETRVGREKAASSGRTQEIQRLIGRSLRGVIDTGKLGERTVKIDCDVIQADGGTRTASITGGFIALALALKKIKKQGLIEDIPIVDFVAAVSVGIFQGELLLDLDYSEDSKAAMDMNVVMVGKGKFIEVQGTAEGEPFSKAEMDKLLDLAKKGIKELIAIQEKALGGAQLS